MSKEHLSVALALNVPVVCVVTKIDSTPPNVLDTTLKQLTKILRSPGCRKAPVFVKNRGMACSLAKDFVKEKYFMHAVGLESQLTRVAGLPQSFSSRTSMAMV